MATVLGKLLKGAGKVVSVGLGAVSKAAGASGATTVSKVTGFVSKILAPKKEPAVSAVASAIVKTASPVVQPDSKGVKVEPMPNMESDLTGIQKKVFNEAPNLQASGSVSFGKDAGIKKGKLLDMNLSSSYASKDKAKTPWAWIAGAAAFIIGVLIFVFSRKRKR